MLTVLMIDDIDSTGANANS